VSFGSVKNWRFSWISLGDGLYWIMFISILFIGILKPFRCFSASSEPIVSSNVIIADELSWIVIDLIFP